MSTVCFPFSIFHISVLCVDDKLPFNNNYDNLTHMVLIQYEPPDGNCNSLGPYHPRPQGHLDD